MKRLGLILVALSMGFVLLQCGGGKEKPAATKTPAAAESTPKAETAAMAATDEMSYDLDNGEAIYKKYCHVCHDAGIAGAARHAQTDRWAESAAKGIPTLVKHATEGYQGKYGVLPQMGTCMECSHQDIIDAVHYQLKMGGALN